MKDEDLNGLLSQLIAGWENEVVEFKQAGNDFDTDKIGRYFSALSNEANLRNQDRGWLIFGVNNRTRMVVGSIYRTEPDRLNGLKHQIASDTEPGVTFRDIHVLDTPQGRVILFEIPAAPRGIPISWKGHYYARAGESLKLTIFIAILAFLGNLARLGRLPRTRPIVPGEIAVSD